MPKLKLSKEEMELLDSYEKGEWKPVKDSLKLKRRYIQYAKNTLKKNCRINIRLSENDLEGIQMKAVQEGIPYQTLVTSVLHRYVLGRLVPRHS